MDWNDLRYFLAVARAGTLAGAARELGVEHTTVGRRISALESALGVRLFSRGPEGLSLTAAGKDVVPRAEGIAAHVDAIERLVTGTDQRAEGRVRLTIPDALNAYMMQALAQLRELHPALIVEVLCDNRDLDLRRGEADLAIRLRDTRDPELIGRRIGGGAWGLYASRSYLARKGGLTSAEALQGHDVIGFDASLAGVPGAVWLGAHAQGANVVLRGNSVAAVFDAALVGLGVAALPCFMADRAPELRRLTPGTIGSRDIMLVVHPDLARVARVRATMDFLIDLFARDAELWSGASPVAE
jgi:DNA-binding transcriptional LysR family regulator